MGDHLPPNEIDPIGDVLGRVYGYLLKRRAEREIVRPMTEAEVQRAINTLMAAMAGVDYPEQEWHCVWCL